jgi:hypothetical protein
MTKIIITFDEIDEAARWLKDNACYYKNILVLSSAYNRSKQILNKLGDSFIPYAEIVRQVDYSRIEIMGTCIEARVVGTGEKLMGVRYDLVVLYDPASLPANVLKEVLT